MSEEAVRLAEDLAEALRQGEAWQEAGMNVAGELVDAQTRIAQLRSELERLRDVVCEEDVDSIDAILEETSDTGGFRMA